MLNSEAAMRPRQRTQSSTDDRIVKRVRANQTIRISVYNTMSPFTGQKTRASVQSAERWVGACCDYCTQLCHMGCTNSTSDFAMSCHIDASHVNNPESQSDSGLQTELSKNIHSVIFGFFDV